ncbi:MAG: nucleoside triphosphate pyrophosphohydrolase [Clostridiales bacterium]|nr:nucleoside triphosphate pyrophosphohydrolase [Clostridiales bacterium]
MKPMITVVSLGPGSEELLTLQSIKALENAENLILRTARHPVAEYLMAQGHAFADFDALYDQFEDFDDMHAEMARRLWQEATSGPVTYGVIDAASDESVKALQSTLPKGAQVTILPGVTLCDARLSQLPPDFAHAGSLRILPAMTAAGSPHDPRTPVMITEIWQGVLAGDIKLWLSDLYDDEMPIVFFPSAVEKKSAAKVIPLMELDRQKVYDHTVCAYIPAAPMKARRRYCFEDLVEILDILRGPGGCPWDREQTHESLKKYLIEEAYETGGAIDEGDPDHIADELGDVLLQVVFHAAVGKAHGTFAIQDVTSAICSKMIYRHAHIFGDDHCATAEEVSDNWERLKKMEKGLTTQASVLADVSKGLPALMRASKVQKKAAQVGFDWDTALEALPKVTEEAQEVLEELNQQRDPAEELGDLLFACVNVVRLCGLDAEEALKNATEKFIRRFTAMENAIILDGKALKGLTLSEMDVYWNCVKAAQKSDAASR